MAAPVRRSSKGPVETRTFGDNEEGEYTAGQIRYKYDLGLRTLATQMQEYWLNDAFLRGYQWLYYSDVAGRLDEIPSDPERVQATVNRMWPDTRIIVSTLMQRALSFEVMPTQADDSHVRGARLAESVARGIHHDHCWEEMREHLYYAVLKGGTAAMCVDWDPDAETTIGDDTPGAPPLSSGDTVEQHLNITQFLVEPGTRYPEKARWWIRAIALPPEEVKAKFDLDDVPPADATAGLAPFHRRLLSYDSGGTTEDADLTIVLTYYERPNPECEKGKVCVVVDHDVVFEGDWPFPFTDRLNLVVVRETPRENHWTGDTVLSAARPLQTLLNVSWSSVVEHMKLAGNARLLIPRSSVDIMDDLTDLPGEYLPYNDALAVKPDYLTPPQMPAWWTELPNRVAREMDDIMGVHDISRGAAPANIESGFGLSILAEKDTTPVSRLTKETAEAFGRLMSMVLAIYEEQTSDTKIERRSLVQMPGHGPRTIVWNGQDFKGQTTALVPQDAILPRSRAAQMEMAKDLLASGLIQSLEEFVAVAELPGQREVLAAVSPDVDRARRENANFGLGRQSIPYPWDDHKAHIHEHNKYRKTVDYEMLTEDDKDLVEAHIKAHETMSAEEIGRGRAMGAIDPALTMMATAEEGPMIPPVEMPPASAPAPAPAALPPGQAPPGVNGLPAAAQLPDGAFGGGPPTPEEATEEIMRLLSGMEGMA